MCQMNTYTSTAYNRCPSYTLKRKNVLGIYMRVEWCFNKKFIKQKLKGPPCVHPFSREYKLSNV